MVALDEIEQRVQLRLGRVKSLIRASCSKLGLYGLYMSGHSA